MSVASEAAFELIGIEKRYPGTVAVRLDNDQRVRFEYGHIHALAGQNGAGKSTLVSIMAGIQRPSAGSMLLRGERYAPSGAVEARARGVDIVLQEPSIIEHMSVEENLLLGREKQFAPRGFFLPGSRRRLAEAAVDLLPRRVDLRARAGSLPLEDQKLVEMARALSLGPSVLIVDEMSAALSEVGAAALRSALRAFASRGGLVIYISHHLDEVVGLCDRVTVLRDGRLVATLEANATSKEEISALMVGGAVEQPNARTVRPGAPVLEVDGLTVDDKCDNVSFCVRRGEVLGIGGLMDSGADAVALSIFGAAKRTKGTVRLEGKPVRWRQASEAVAAGVAYVPPDRDRDGLVLTQRIDRNIDLAALRWVGRWGFVSPRRSAAIARDLVSRLSIRCRGCKDVPLNLSGGNRQKVVLAKWLVRDGRLLILHNPTRGVDVGGRAEIHAAVNHLVDRGLAVLLISDDLQELITMSDSILIMRRGRISAQLSADEQPTEKQLIGYML